MRVISAHAERRELPPCNDDDEENASFSVEEQKASKKEENDEMKSKAGVHVLCLDGRTGQLEMATTNDIGPNVAFVTRHPTKPDVIYGEQRNASTWKAKW